MPQKVTWFIKPQDRHTNDIIASRISAENFIEKRDGIENLWRCESYAFVTELKKNKKQLNLNFKVYRVRGNGKIEKWPFV